MINIPSNVNWVDWTIVAILLYNAYAGWQSGLLSLLISLISLAGSLWVAILTNHVVSQFLTNTFGVPATWSAIGGYLVVALIAQLIISELLHSLAEHLPEKILNSKFNTVLGSLISICNGIIVIAFFLLLILTLPLRGTVKNDIQKSWLGSMITQIAKRYDAPIESTMVQMRQAAIRFMTISPKSGENITLDVAPKESDLSENTTDEQKMVELVNKERAVYKIAPLTVDVKLTQVARAHSRDMFIQRYFSHVAPDRKDPGDRMEAAHILYTVAGENIAYAPDVVTAHTGLMNSPEHKKNILDPTFHKVGIGIISTASMGSMYTQDFTN